MKNEIIRKLKKVGKGIILGTHLEEYYLEDYDCVCFNQLYIDIYKEDEEGSFICHHSLLIADEIYCDDDKDAINNKLKTAYEEAIEIISKLNIVEKFQEFVHEAVNDVIYDGHDDEVISISKFFTT